MLSEKKISEQDIEYIIHVVNFIFERDRERMRMRIRE